MKQLRKVSSMLFVGLLLLTACGTKATPSQDLAKKIFDKDVKSLMLNTPDNLGTGEVELASVTEFYKNMTTKWDEMLNGDGGVPVQYKEQVEAQRNVSKQLETALANGEILDVAYVGESKDDEATGLFIYHFNETAQIQINDIEKANEFTKAAQAGEFYYVKDNYFFAYQQNFVKDEAALVALINEVMDPEATKAA